MTDRKELNRSIVIRVDDDLYEAIERDAQENERTISQSIRYKLRLSLA